MRFQSSPGSLLFQLVLSTRDNFCLPLAVGAFGLFEYTDQLLALWTMISECASCGDEPEPSRLTVLTALPVWSTTMTVLTRPAMMSVEFGIRAWEDSRFQLKYSDACRDPVSKICRRYYFAGDLVDLRSFPDNGCKGVSGTKRQRGMRKEIEVLFHSYRSPQVVLR